MMSVCISLVGMVTLILWVIILSSAVKKLLTHLGKPQKRFFILWATKKGGGGGGKGLATKKKK